MSWRELAPQQLFNLKNALIVDVRAPCEHAQERIPGSVNIPLLNDDERAVVGTIYAGEGEVTARRAALKIIAPKIPELVDQILALRKQGGTLVVHCWRGGLRSEAVASFLSVVGVDCWRLTGGYKGWRRLVIEDFKTDNYPFFSVVLHGQTGTGKTEILTELANAGCAVLDLERLASHRGSVFGKIGMAEQPTQKNFEADLWLRLREFNTQKVFLEGESRKVGRISLPNCILQRINTGSPILVTGSLPRRVDRILSDYTNNLVPAEAIECVNMLRQWIGASRVDTLQELLLQGDYRKVAEILLLEYYDPMYNRQLSKLEPFDLVVSGDDPCAASAEILKWCQSG